MGAVAGIGEYDEAGELRVRTRHHRRPHGCRRWR
jgi:hypothetical protein